MTISPDGKRAVVRHARNLSYEFDQKVPPVAFLFDVASGQEKPLFTDGKILPGRVWWTQASGSFFISSRYSSDPVYRTAK